MQSQNIDGTDVILEHKNTQFKFYEPYNEDNIRTVLPLLSKLKTERRNDGLVKGVVRTILDGKIIDHSMFNIRDKNGKDVKLESNVMENIVVAKGRRYIAQRLFGTRHPSDLEVHNWEISHFGLGSGGAITVGSFVNLMGPELCDQDNYNPTALTGSPPDPIFLTSPGDNIKDVSPTEYAVKPIEPSGMIDIILTSDIDCDFGPTFSYVRCVCVKSIQEPNYLPEDDDYILINESCLYYSDGNSAQTFAHICFPPKYVEKKSEFVVEWYILC